MSRVFGVLAICVTSALALLGASASVGQAKAGTIDACLYYKGHLYEACYAYIVNDSSLALRQYYANAHSTNPKQAADALEDFRYRYRGSARALIQKRVASWPRGRNNPGIPGIEILKASSSLVTNTAQLTTREIWRVTTSSGRVLYTDKAKKIHHISMARVQGKLLHIWVVTDIS
jgi:hypothetical protein